MKKRIFAFLLTISFLLPLFPYSIAIGDTYIAVNNSLLPITDAAPIKSDGIWYIDYRCFTDSELGVNGSYNPDSQTLALYTWDYTLAFNIMSGTATNKTTDSTYKRWAFLANGTIYVPAQFVAAQLGMTYSYIPSVNVLRIKTTSILPDSMFTYIARDEIPRLIDRYNASKPQKQEPQKQESQKQEPQKPSPQKQNPPKQTPQNNPAPVAPQNNDAKEQPQNKTDSNNKPSVPNVSSNSTNKIDAPQKTDETVKNEILEEEQKEKTVYLTFDVGAETDCAKILSLLQRENISATFFIFGSSLPVQDDTIRQIATEGHSIGISAFGATSEFLSSVESVKSDLAATNELLFQVCYTKSRLVRIPGGSAALSDEQANALSDSGYRYWDWDIDASDMSMNRFQTIIASKGDTVVIRFDASKNSIQNLASILKFLSENNYTAKPISLLTPPRNLRHDMR